MKKLTCLILICCIMITMTACSKTVKPDDAGELKSISFAFSADKFGGDYKIYTLNDGTVMFLSKESDGSSNGYPVEVPKSVMQDFNKIIEENGYWKWNNFDKRNNNVSDGYGFILALEYENAALTATGHAIVPKDYRTLISPLKQYFKHLERNYPPDSN